MMRRISLSLLAATAMGLILSQAASAADLGMPTKAPVAPLPPPAKHWSGIYVGLEGGYGWGKENLNPAFDPFFFSKAGPADKFAGFLDPTISSVSQSGWLAGGFAGAQKQWGSWVLGIEADFDWADIKGTRNGTASACAGNALICGGSSLTSGFANRLTRSQSIESKIDELGSVRGKVGWAFSQNWMIYGTGGLALAHTQ